MAYGAGDRLYLFVIALYPNLTEENLRVCAYIKMGFSGKQIAHTLNIDYRSALNHRHRLKKKMELSDKDDLDSFIRSL